MNFEWLRYFATLADTRNFHAAADRLAITPQALSKAIASLEKELGAPLVERDHRVKGLTPAGEALLEEASLALNHVENARRRISEYDAREPSGPVTIAGDGLWHH
ncbi:MAG: LysR family transcriptional regulator, partial [Cyanobacteria bacterium REEB65]|nr:LysR family transcriptional regulator [Cyanobacteria bacterium REEB65]